MYIILSDLAQQSQEIHFSGVRGRFLSFKFIFTDFILENLNSYLNYNVSNLKNKRVET